MNLVTLVRLTLVLSVFVILMGVYTRLSDAGLGCPDWPGCYGQLTVPSEADIPKANMAFPERAVEPHKAWLEMIHRYLAGALGLLIFAVSALSIKQKVMGPTLPVLLSAVTVFQALLGMWTVTLKLLPIIVMGHLLGGFTILACLSIMSWRLNQSREPIDHLSIPSSIRTLAVIAFIVVVFQVILGGWTSSNYAALMCSRLPICEGDWMSQLNFAVAFDFLQTGHTNYEFGVLDYDARMTIHVTHRIGAIVTVLAVLALATQCINSMEHQLHGAGWRMIFALLLQVALGVSNVLLHLPLGIAVAHNLGAALLLVTVLHANFLLWQPNREVALGKESTQ
ncbi:COX15/CtaA family protein [Vibrio sp. 10N.261.55.A7]|uniref:COX15/CtaA family protein n=1 Tax=Vibrio sp. 10N.261.55.A7 TaxID=1880851 RepID=UPI000C821EAA|nr:COX15/CtaA family protein [Vibrio sp. 10N.261.55.A7]PMJ98705.1 cytochrome B [Vibrio sp. 10N.261.55.A7]